MLKAGNHLFPKPLILYTHLGGCVQFGGERKLKHVGMKWMQIEAHLKDFRDNSYRRKNRWFHTSLDDSVSKSWTILCFNITPLWFFKICINGYIEYYLKLQCFSFFWLLLVVVCLFVLLSISPGKLFDP